MKMKCRQWWQKFFPEKLRMHKSVHLWGRWQPRGKRLKNLQEPPLRCGEKHIELKQWLQQLWIPAVPAETEPRLLISQRPPLLWLPVAVLGLLNMAIDPSPASAVQQMYWRPWEWSLILTRKLLKRLSLKSALDFYLPLFITAPCVLLQMPERKSDCAVFLICWVHWRTRQQPIASC